MTVSQTMTTIDPITLEVLWNRILSVTNEQQAALMRTAFSTVVRESQDLACGVFDTRGYMIAQSETGTPGHINDITIVNPIFLDPSPGPGQAPRIVAYFANTCHMADIGGRLLSAEARE